MNWTKEDFCIGLLRKAQGDMMSAEVDLSHDLTLNRAVSSIYYSAFHTVSALMILREIATKHHQYVRQYVNKVLVLEEGLDLEMSRMYNNLMSQRSDADYDVRVDFERDIVVNLMDRTKEFNTWVRALIDKELGRGQVQE